MDTAYTERCLNELDAYKRRIAEAKDRCRAALEELSKHTAYGSPGDQTRAIASLYEAIDEFSYDDVSVIVGRSLFHPGRPVL